MSVDNDHLADAVPVFCKRVGISVRTFYYLNSEGKGPPTIRIRGRRLVRREAGEQWLRSLEQIAA